MPRKSWWARLPFSVRMASGATALLVVIGGSVAGISAMVRDEPRVVQAAAREQPILQEMEPAPVKPAASPAVATAGLGAQAGKHAGRADAPADSRRISDEADRTATRRPRETPKADKVRPDGRPGAAAPAAPAVTTRTVSETRPIPFQTQLVRDRSLPRGTRRVQAPGIVGEQTLRYVVTYTDGRETGRRFLDAIVTKQPQHRVVAFGSRRGWGPDRGNDRPPECGLIHDGCVPISRSALCPEPEPKADATQGAEPSATATATDNDTAASPAERPAEFYLIDPADVADLELDPGIICE